MNYTQEDLNASRVAVEVTGGAQFIRLWSSMAKQNAIASGTRWAYPALPAGIYIEGIAVGTATIDLVFYDPQNAERSRDTILVNVVQADIDADSDNDNTIAAADDETERNAPGKLVRQNVDDDDGNHILDLMDTPPLQAPDDDLVQVNLAFNGQGLSQADLADIRLRLEITEGAQFIRLWDTNTKNNEIVLPLQQPWTLAQLPASLFVEGIASGAAELRLTVSCL
jgi:hypothetical protein